MSKILNKILRYTGYILFRPIWLLERLVPRSKNIWVFGAWYGQKYSDNSKWLYEYVLEHNSKIKAVWITKNRDVYNKLQSQNKPVAFSASFKGAWWCLRSKYVLLSSTQLDVNRFFLNGCKQVWLWHGMPLKKILLSENSKKSMIRDLLNPYEKFSPDYTITSSDFFIPFLSEAFGLSEANILKTGLPRCDVLKINSAEENFITSIRKKYSKSRILLYMPTFRMQQMGNGKAFNPFVKEFGFNEEQFNTFLEKNNIIFLYKPHYVDEQINITINSRRFFRIDDSKYDDLYALLSNIDVLITDYSSVYFDFLATNKPTILLAFDYEQYKKTSRDVYFDLNEEVDATKYINWTEFFNTADFLYFSEKDKMKFSQYLDGNSCKNLLNYFCTNIEGKWL